jgi:type I restriction enzyme R subunit
MERDPVFYTTFSKMLEAVIAEFSDKRLHEREYLKRVTEIMKSVVHRTGDAIPSKLQHRDVAKAHFGIVNEVLAPACGDQCNAADIASDAALAVDDIINELRIVNWTTNNDVQNQMRTRIEDYLWDLRDARGVDLAVDQIDLIMERCLDVARVRCPGGHNDE